jgi:uncharacterized protein (DUF2147 family)
MRKTVVAILLAMAASAASGGTVVNSPDGLWLNPHKSVAVRTGPCSDRLCGWVVWADAEALSDARDSGIDKLIGTRLLEDYQSDGAGQWSGTVYVPDMDRHFASQIQQISSHQLKIKGCILGGLFCRSQLWTRIERIPDA